MHQDNDNDPGPQGAAIWLDRVNDAYYDRLSERMGRRTRERINWMCAQCRGGTVLDIGCSQGITSILLGREGFRALGIDIMEEAIDFARGELEAEPDEVRGRVTFERLDLMSMPVGEGYDNVILGEVVEHQTSAARFLEVAQRHVAPGGRMIVTVPFGLHPFPDHKCTVYPGDIVGALDGFHIDTLEVVNGYIRVVAIKAADAVAVEPGRVLEVTERGAEEAQALYFETVETSRKVDLKRRELAEKLKDSTERSRKAVRIAEQELSNSREEVARLKSQLLVLRNESLGAEKQVEAIAAELRAAGDEVTKLRSLHADVSKQLEASRAESESLIKSYEVEAGRGRRNEQRLREAVRKAEREKAALQQRYEKKIAQMLDYRRRLGQQHDTVKGWLEDANAEVRMLRESVSFRLGHAFVSAFRSPRDLAALPLRLGRIFVGVLRRPAAQRSPSGASGAKEEDPGRAFGGHDRGRAGRAAGDAEKKLARPSDVRPVALASERARMLPPLDVEPVATVPRHPFPDNVSDLRVAAIMDDFTRESFRHCCKLQQLSPSGWKEEMELFRPHLVLVESAWKGEGGRWAQKIYPLSAELGEMLLWARESGIPTAFWNKEDPVHFSVFLPTARQFDHVFTTDIDCIKSYRAELGHDRVYLLPFACEPRKHNPIETHERVEGFCFAGSYYAKYPERQRDFSSIIGALRGVSQVDIYDRNHGTSEPSLKFPDEYVPLIRGNLPYDQIDKAYKGYRYGVNINTVKQSQSMFARRAFDLMASNTVTISNYSRGMRLMFGDLVISSDQGSEIATRLEPLLRDEAAYRKLRLRGLRKVLSEHTYEDRLSFLASKVSGRVSRVEMPAILVLARACSGDALAKISAAFDRQSYQDRRLALSLGEGVDPGPLAGRADVDLLDRGEASRLDLAGMARDGFVAVFDPSDYYGHSYLADLALATRFSDAAMIGKKAHYSAEGGAEPALQADGAQYHPVESLAPRASILRGDALAGVSPAALLDLDDMPRPSGRAALATDEFSYCRAFNGEACPAVDDIVLDTGIELARLQAMAEASHGPGEAGPRGDVAFTGFGPSELARLFPEGEYSDGRVRVDAHDDGVAISSKLGPGKFTYVYANAPIPAETLFPDEIGRFNMLVSSGVLLSITLIFLDAGQRRIGHVIRACNSNQGLVPIEGTRYVMLGFRIQGGGQAKLRRLVLQHVPAEVDAIAGKSRHLLVTRSYPAYDNLYSYGFVHSRVAGYRRSGVQVDVFQLGSEALSYDEFQNVDVVRGSVGDLALMMGSNQYESVLVHSFDEQIWSVVQGYLPSTRVIVWLHGAEIQPWYRRDFNHADEADRVRAIQRSDMRMGLWRRIFEEMPENLHLVFVSEHLAQQAMMDVGIRISPDQYSVIHNLIDGDFFEYQEKDVALRHRVLSIRPYTHQTYANDLATKAILDLSDEPWFGDMAFSLFGDGRLFDETVEPLRRFSNVRLEKRFLTKQEIRDAHRRHGVFLVPSRIDSQGVSRDEAMASGLVPVTNRVAAIPEFVDESVGMLADPGDWKGLADAIRRLHNDPALFARMSAAAAHRVRAQSGPAQTLEREVALISGQAARASTLPAPVEPRRIAVYGDLNLNLVDGSAIWAASLVEVLAGLPGVEVDLFLKAKLKDTKVLAAVIPLPNVRLVEPGAHAGTPVLQPEEAVASLVEEDARRPYEAIVLRGYAVCRAAGGEPRLDGRLWAYLTDIPQDPELLDESWRSGLDEIARASRYVLCQTQALEELLHGAVPAMRGRTRRLPPMIPGQAIASPDERDDGVLKIVYAGKFAPAWGIREMLDVAGRLRDLGVPFEFHVYGDKIHNPPEDPGFRDEIRQRLGSTPGVVWHGATTRAGLLAALAGMDVGWAWRLPDLESRTLELSTKLLEYGHAGLAVVMAPGPANLEAFGGDYPFLAANPDEALALLAKAAADRSLLEAAAGRSRNVAASHTFEAVRDQWVRRLLDPATTGTEGHV